MPAGHAGRLRRPPRFKLFPNRPSPFLRLAPRQQARHAFGHAHLRLPADLLSRQIVRDMESAARGQAHGARRVRPDLRFQVALAVVEHQPHQFTGGDGCRAGHVHRDIGRVALERGDVGARHVRDMHEVLGVGAVAGQHGTLALAHAVIGLHDVQRIRGAVVLALAIHGGIAQHHIVQPGLLVVLAAQLLAHDLGGAIQDRRGRRADGMERAVLGQRAGDAAAVAVDRVGRSENELLHLVGAAGFQHVLRAADVHVHRLPRRLREAQRHVGSQVQHAIHAIGRGQQVGQAHQVAAHHFHARIALQVGDGLGRAKGEVVQQDHLAHAGGQQRVGGVRAHQAGGAGDQDAGIGQRQRRAFLVCRHVIHSPIG